LVYVLQSEAGLISCAQWLQWQVTKTQFLIFLIMHP